MVLLGDPPPKAASLDLIGRFREIISDPINLLIPRMPRAGLIEDGLVYLHNGLRVPVEGEKAYYGDFSHIFMLNRGVHEPLQEFIFHTLLSELKAAPTMLELGAYWAFYSMWLKRARPAARVIMVETTEPFLQVGYRNFELNDLQGEFMLGTIAPGAETVDGILAEYKLDRLTILHADIEGAEADMLDGAKNALDAARIDYLFVSTHSQKLHQQVVTQLGDCGYRVEVSNDFEQGTTSCDGLVFASSPLVNPVFAHFNPLGRAEITTSAPGELLRSLTEVR